MSNKNKTVPRLRFPEFQDAGDWEEKRLGDIGNVSMCKRVLKHETSVSGDIPFYKIGTFGKHADAYIPKELYERYRDQYSFPQKGEILISASGTIGRIVVYDGSPAYFQDSNIVWISNNEKIATNAFLLFCYGNTKWKTSDNTIARLYNDNLRSIEILVPTLPEQQKIAACLSSLDDLITAQAQKLAQLKTHKKGLMQLLFPAEGETLPRLRFPEFQGAGDWEEKRLGEVATFLKGKGISKADVTADGKQPCIRYGELYTIYNETIENINSYTNLLADNLVLSKANDVIIPSSGETQEDIATASCVINDGIALGGDLNIIRSKMNGLFLSYYLNHAKKKSIAQLAQGIVVVHLYSSQLKKLSVNIPKVKEQQKIADCLSSLDDIITAQAQKLAQLKTHKKGLMQQMFPAPDEVNG